MIPKLWISVALLTLVCVGEKQIPKELAEYTGTGESSLGVKGHTDVPLLEPATAAPGDSFLPVKNISIFDLPAIFALAGEPFIKALNRTYETSYPNVTFPEGLTWVCLHFNPRSVKAITTPHFYPQLPLREPRSYL